MSGYDDGWDFDYQEYESYDDDDDNPYGCAYGENCSNSAAPVVLVLVGLILIIIACLVGSFYIKRKVVPTPDNVVSIVLDGTVEDLPEMAERLRQLDKLDEEFFAMLDKVSQSGKMTKEEVENLAQQGTGSCGVSKAFPPNVYRWCDLITRYARAAGLNPNLVAALITVESAGNPRAYSRDGAVGLMQVMPRDGIAAKFKNSAGVPYFADRPSIAQLSDPEFNVKWGTSFLASKIRNYGLRGGLKAYGPSGVGYYYADLVLTTQKKYDG